MKAFVKIQSTKTINVTPGLQAVDNTIADLHVVDRLKVSAAWPRACVLIRRGVYWYPSEIVEWATVKALNNDNIITIGEESDVPGEVAISKEAMQAKLEEVKTEDTVEAEQPKRRRKVVEDSLESLAE